MESGRWKAGGHSFRTKAEYEAALRDLEKIRLLKEKTNYSKKESILELYNRMQTGSISFETVLGREFDDEVYEQVRRIRAGQFEEVGKSRQPVRNNRISEKSLKKKRQKPPGVKVLTRGQYIARRIMMSVLLLIAAGCLGYFSIYCMEAVKKDREQQQMAKLKENTKLNAMGKDEVVVHLDTEEKSYVVLEKYKNLYKTNKNLIGWLKIDDTNIDYPVMQTVNNEYYLDHNTKQEKDKNGTLFLDKDCSITRTSTNFIIYGHHMKSGKMFGDLDHYKEEDFYKKHKTISFDTIYEEGTYEVMYVFLSKIYYEEEVVFKYYQFIDANSEQEFDSYMEEMAQMSLYDTGVTAQYGDQLLTLSTCDYEQEDGRFVVVAKRIS
ncbi:MAG: class B sortase [Lachnospiraceae bacterium]|nr:class B sortase [Lachnospiraceae bacterium]